MIFFVFPSRSVAAGLAIKAVCRAGPLDGAFDLMELNDGLVSRPNHSVLQLTLIVVVLGLQFGEGAVDGGMSFGQGLHVLLRTVLHTFGEPIGQLRIATARRDSRATL